MQYRKITYEAEIADTSRDGKQIRIIKKTMDKFRPDETEVVATLDYEQAEQLLESLQIAVAKA